MQTEETYRLTTLLGDFRSLSSQTPVLVSVDNPRGLVRLVDVSHSGGDQGEVTVFGAEKLGQYFGKLHTPKKGLLAALLGYEPPKQTLEFPRLHVMGDSAPVTIHYHGRDLASKHLLLFANAGNIYGSGNGPLDELGPRFISDTDLYSSVVASLTHIQGR